MAKRKDTPEKPKITREKLRSAIRIFRFIRPYRWSFFFGLVLLAAGSVLFMVFPGAATEMAKTARGVSEVPLTLPQWGLFFLILLIIQGLFSFFRVILFAKVSEKGMADVRQALYDKIITQSVPFFENRRVGELTSRITADVEQLQQAFSITLAEFLRQIVVLIVGVAILAYMTPRLALIMLLTFPVIVVLAMVFGRMVQRISRKRQDMLAESNIVVEETLQNHNTVKAFTNELLESNRYNKTIQDVVKISLKYARIRGVFFIFIITVLFGGIFFILWQGAMMVEAGTMDVEDLFSFILYTGIIGSAIAGLGSLYTSLAGAVGATERIQEILESETETSLSNAPLDKADILKGNIEYKNVSFSYPSRKDLPVLNNISFNINAGQKVALVGSSGAGKSTIVQLLLKFYDVDQGAIIVDGKDISSIDLYKLRKNIAIVPQEVILFGGTIRENIRYGKPNATEAEIIEAAKQSNSWEFIESFPDGLETIVGDRGIKLSGGQRQRIAIARAILRNPAILLLDEATSSLDAESEKVVQEALNHLMKNRTSIIIAHRLATIREVDCIYVLEHGKIVEQGTHENLSAIEDGAYSNLAKLQFETQAG